ncbi:MAG: DUF1801 domain-containing protein [Cyclobacteriaceae bacterium]|nr:DUF1801 domain-containing protein [Cyclobacteriaceae bacterium]
MAELKTKKTAASVEAFIEKIADESQRDSAWAVLNIMKGIEKSDAAMWGAAIVGFGKYTYTYSTGKTGDWPVLAFAPRKGHLTIYILTKFPERQELLKTLGKYKISGGCLHFKKIDDLHLPTLKKLLISSRRHVLKTHST